MKTQSCPSWLPRPAQSLRRQRHRPRCRSALLLFATSPVSLTVEHQLSCHRKRSLAEPPSQNSDLLAPVCIGSEPVPFAQLPAQPACELRHAMQSKVSDRASHTVCSEISLACKAVSADLAALQVESAAFPSRPAAPLQNIYM